jgi:Uma2 family endonuclease
MGATKVLLTAEEFDNYPFEEDKRYEFDEGELIATTKPAYKHNHILLDLLMEVAQYFENNPIGEVLLSENVYALSPNIRRSPDLAVILGDCRQELWNATVIHIVPDIAAEVLSPEDTPLAILRKLGQYFRAGIKEVWLVDPDSRTVNVLSGPTPPARELADGDVLTSSLLPGFSLALEALFSLR